MSPENAGRGGWRGREQEFGRGGRGSAEMQAATGPPGGMSSPLVQSEVLAFLKRSCKGLAGRPRLGRQEGAPGWDKRPLGRLWTILERL